MRRLYRPLGTIRTTYLTKTSFRVPVTPALCSKPFLTRRRDLIAICKVNLCMPAFASVLARLALLTSGTAQTPRPASVITPALGTYAYNLEVSIKQGLSL